MSRWKRLLVAALAAFILACSWGLWGTVEEPLDVPSSLTDFMPDFGDFDDLDLDEELDDLVGGVLDTELFETPTVTFDVTGWRGRILPRGLDSPNVIAVVAAVLMGLLALTPARGRWPAVLALQLAVYGTFHLGVLTVELSQQEGMRPAGWGVLAAFVASALVLVSGLADWRDDLTRKGIRGTVKHRVTGAFGLAPTQPARRTRKATGKRKTQVKTPASFSRRAAAYAVDCACIGLWIGILTGLAQLLPEETLAAAFDGPGVSQMTILLALMLPVVCASAAIESAHGHATPGKRLLKIRVRHLGPGKLRYGRALARNALKFLPWELAHTALWRIEGWPSQVVEFSGLSLVLMVLVWVILLVDALMIGLRPDGQSLHDLAAETQVLG